jgi:hypothetical protein
MKRGSFDYLLDPAVKLNEPPVVFLPPPPPRGGGGPQRIHVQIEITDRLQRQSDPGPSILARLVGLALFVIMVAWLVG